MKVLSLTQPWATLVAIGAKQYETRSWRPAMRTGTLAIQAAKGFPTWAQDICFDYPFYDVLAAAGLWRSQPGSAMKKLDLPRGAIVAVVDLVECLPTGDEIDGVHVLHLTAQERSFGDFSPGRWAWRFENVRALAEPIPVRGYQFLWDLEPDVVEAIEHQLQAVHA